MARPESPMRQSETRNENEHRRPNFETFKLQVRAAFDELDAIDDRQEQGKPREDDKVLRPKLLRLLERRLGIIEDAETLTDLGFDQDWLDGADPRDINNLIIDIATNLHRK